MLQLRDLPPVLLAHAFEFADADALLALECASRSLLALAHDFHLWRALMHHTAHMAASAPGDDERYWKKAVQLALETPQSGHTLLNGVRACTSVDNPSERPENTLTRSLCETNVERLWPELQAAQSAQHVLFTELAHRIQVACGCAHGHPCYWSTAASWTHTGQDCIEYTMRRNAIVASVGVTPYRVFWYPGSPTYSPLQLSFSLHELLEGGGGSGSELGPAVYESPLYDAVADMKMQVLDLPRKAFLRRGVLRLQMFGRQQELGDEMLQWHRENNSPPFYICLSFVGAERQARKRETVPVMQYDAGNNALERSGGIAMPRRDKQLQPSTPAIDLEHTIGFSAVPNAIHVHPCENEYIYPSGGSLLVTSFQDAHSQLFLRGHDAHITCVAMSASGRLLASGEHGKRADVLVWDYATKRLMLRLSEHDAGIAAVAFSDDERLLCTVGVPEDGRLYIWDVHTGNICATHQKLSSFVTSVAFGGMARDVKRRDTPFYQFATAGHRVLLLWVLNPMNGELTPSKVEQSVVRDYTCVQFAPDRETLVAGSSSGDFSVVNVKTRRLVKNVPACSCGINAIAFFDAGVLVGGGDGTVLHFDLDFVDTSHVVLDGPVVGLALTASQGEAVVGTQIGSIFRVRLHAQRVLQASLLFESHSSAVIHVAYAPSVSDRFATASRDCTIRVWDASDYSIVAKSFVSSAGSPTCLQYSLDVLLSGWTDGSVRCHSADSGEHVWSIDNAHTGGVTALVLSHNQRFIVSAGVGGDVRVWDIRKRDLVSHLKEHSMAVTSLALYEDDLHVLSCSRDRSILCWDLRSERRLSSHIQRMGGINTVALSADQKLVLSAGQEKRISFWDLRVDSPVRVIQKAHDEEATCIAVAHGLGVFATGGNDRVVKLWDFDSGELLMDGVGHSGGVRGLAFSPDDRQLVSAGDDGSIFIWNVYTE
ncbi:hypothetical protein PybrP1_001311 [[Pythium] brassicae (nom. inval.)]|nr:hypothetical protein PybrP1_001311 [[Pythium] brassicae (nom. inval.)]